MFSFHSLFLWREGPLHQDHLCLNLHHQSNVFVFSCPGSSIPTPCKDNRQELVDNRQEPVNNRQELVDNRQEPVDNRQEPLPL